MKITIYGVGYVGLVTGVCLAEIGHDVCCMDVDLNKIEKLQRGEVPIYEEGLVELLHKTRSEGKIQFTTDVRFAIDHGRVQMIAVGTPPKPDGSADLSHVLAVATTLSEYISEYRLIVNKSTVPVGTADQVRQCILKGLNKRALQVDFDVVSNPEFLKEGKALYDFLNPDRIIIGAHSEFAVSLMRELYAPLVDEGRPFVIMDTRSSELTKYASNAFLATKISFMNEMSGIAESCGANINDVKKGMGYDQRIGSEFLNPGCGYGGSCFPKDVSALASLANALGYPASILPAVQETNERQKRRLFRKIFNYFEGDLEGRCIALWGIAFKPGTDDIREAPSLILMEQLWAAGARVQAYDPMAMPNCNQCFPNQPLLELCLSRDDCLRGAHALVIMTEWPTFREPDFFLIKQSLEQPIIFDGRNIYHPDEVARHGLQYQGIGVGASSRTSLSEETTK